MKQLRLIMITSIVGIMSGCATITTGTAQDVSVITEKDVKGAKCTLTDSKGGVWHIAQTPGSVLVRKGDGPMKVVCDKEKYKTATLEVAETFQGATLGNILIGGGVGIIVDAVSGAAQKYPDEVVLWMEPEQWRSEEEKIQWFKAKDLYEKGHKQGL